MRTLTLMGVAVMALAAVSASAALAFTFESVGGGAAPPSAADKQASAMAPGSKLDLDYKDQPQFGVQSNPSFDSGPLPQWDKFNSADSPLRRGYFGR